MATTLEDLEKRLSALEQELTSLRQAMADFSKEVVAKRRERRRLKAALAQAELTAGWEKAMRAMGIPPGEPIGAQKLRQRMLESGIKPEDNAFSRGIVEMREE